MLAIVLTSIMADTLKHITLLPGKMAARLLLANVHSTGKLEAWLILAIVRADMLEHATLLPGKMAA